MINSELYGNSIVNALFNTGNKTSNSVSFPTTPYIALFTKKPSKDGTGYTEPTSTEYARVLLTNKGAYGKQMMGTSATDGTDGGVNYATVKNQDLIVFPEAKSAAFGTIVGVGIFSVATGGTPYIWGDLTSSVTVNIGEIPIFREEDFVFKLA